MNPIKHLRRFAAVLTGLVAATVAFATPAFAMQYPQPGGTGGASGPVPPVQVHTVITGGMPGWQIALIAIGAALFAATAAVLLDRARATRKAVTATA